MLLPNADSSSKPYCLQRTTNYHYRNHEKCIFVSMEPQRSFHAIGLMSGTSLDGVDLAYCRFTQTNDGWDWELLDAQCFPHPPAAVQELGKLHTATAHRLAETHVRYGRVFGAQVKYFLIDRGIESVDVVASHGHTVFHQPDWHFTTQIGDGAALAAACGQLVAADFRTLDVAHGGQGAPLVPIGDRHLFGRYEACLNLGGIANISYEENGQRIAYDIGPANIVLNPLAQQLGQPYDKGGALAARGTLLPELLETLNALPYYTEPAPKSLGREWIDAALQPLLPGDAKPEDLLRTLVEHSAMMIGQSAPSTGTLLTTGGGSHNAFFMERIRAHCGCEVVVPEADIVDYKEAIVFAFLGVLRLLGVPNTLSSVTGASKDVCGGALYLP